MFYVCFPFMKGKLKVNEPQSLAIPFLLAK